MDGARLESSWEREIFSSGKSVKKGCFVPGRSGGMKDLAPGKSGREEDLAPGKSTGEEDFIPGRSGGEEDLAPGKSTGEEDLAPGKSGREEDLAPGKSTGEEDGLIPGSEMEKSSEDFLKAGKSRFAWIMGTCFPVENSEILEINTQFSRSSETDSDSSSFPDFTRERILSMGKGPKTLSFFLLTKRV